MAGSLQTRLTEHMELASYKSYIVSYTHFQNCKRHVRSADNTSQRSVLYQTGTAYFGKYIGWPAGGECRGPARGVPY
jgi:hypothetical protein